MPISPIHAILFSKGLYTVKRLRSELLRLHRLFSESYSVLGGLKIRWVYYTPRPEPALIGYVNYKLNLEYLDYLKQKGVNVEEWLTEIFAYTLALGIGAGRAAGFGHVEIKPLKSSRSVETRLKNSIEGSDIKSNQQSLETEKSSV